HLRREEIHVGPGAEGTSRPGEYGDVHRLITIQITKCICQLRPHDGRPRVESLRPVQGDGPDTVRFLQHDGFIRHCAASSMSRASQRPSTGPCCAWSTSPDRSLAVMGGPETATAGSSVLQTVL